MMTNFQERKIKNKLSIAEYKAFNPAQYKSIISKSNSLHGKTILHINATPEGGGVAELLASQVALERSLGINSRWFYINTQPEFFSATKKIHNLLQGQPGKLNFSEQGVYLETNQILGESLAQLAYRINPDLIVIHDPQPLPVIKYFQDRSKLILRLHIDLSEPNPWMVKFLMPYLNEYGQIVTSGSSFAKQLPAQVRKKLSVIYPAIDPLSEKNLTMDPKYANLIMNRLKIDPYRPIISQVSRFDPWKDPVGVIDAFLLAKEEIPNLQLVLAGIIKAKDDPQAWEILDEVKKRAGNNPDIFLFWDEVQIKPYKIDEFVNAVFTSSMVVVQNSNKEGFGLTATEAMWKGKPVIGGPAHGIKVQIKHNKTGFIAPDKLKLAKTMIKLVKDPKLCKKIGTAGQLSVKKQFLLPRYLLDNLKVYAKQKAN